MKKLLSRNIMIAIGLMLTLQVQLLAHGHLVVIANKNLEIDTVPHDVIKDIFTGKGKFIKDGIKPIIGLREESEALHQKFCQDLFSLSPIEMKKSWARRIYSGANIAPTLIRGDDDEAKKWIQVNPNGITYIFSSNLDDTVKILKFEEKETPKK